MNIEENWQKALKNTEIMRARAKPLRTFEVTILPYVFLAESSVNMGDTVVRKGSVRVEKPSLILPDHLPQFKGFEFEKDFPFGEEYLNTFFMVRGVRFPSLHYDNRTDSLDVFEGRLKKAIEHYSSGLQRKEDLDTGLVIGAEDCWQLSIIILICHQILRQSDGDLKRLLDEYRKNRE